MDDLLRQLNDVLIIMRANVAIVLWLVAGLFVVQVINQLLHYRLNQLGIYPRHLFGLPGIVFSPFLHSNFTHLFFNAIPLFVLLNFMLMLDPRVSLHATITIILISGLLTWLLGRRGIHIGASAVIMGFWSYLLADAIQHPSIKTIFLGIISIYYFGGLFLNLFPSEKGISWESHIFGFIAGIVAIYFFY